MKHKKIYAGLGKTLVRISDNLNRGSEVSLGYEYYIGDNKLDEPVWELPEHYKKVEISKEDLRLGMIFNDELDGTPYTIVAFNEEGKPIYKEGIHEVEVPEGY